MGFVRYVRVSDGTVVDISPLKTGGNPLAFVSGKWVTFDGVLGDISSARPLTKVEVEALIKEQEGK